MIELRGVTAGGFRGASFAVGAGESCRLLLESEADLTLFLRLIVGTARPIEGALLLFGQELATVAESEALDLFGRIGLVWPTGGFISNLKTWENILLPLWYHGDAQAARREDEVIDLLGRLGMEPGRVPAFLAALPGTLPEQERLILGVTRAMMQDARLMVYAGLFEGLDGPSRARLHGETLRHQARGDGRASLYVAASPQGLPEPFDGISLRQGVDGGIAPWR